MMLVCKISSYTCREVPAGTQSDASVCQECATANFEELDGCETGSEQDGLTAVVVLLVDVENGRKIGI